MTDPARHPAPHRDGVIVLGAPRSGTTLVRRLLDAHPNITAPGETHLLAASARFLSSEPSSGGLDVGVLTGLGYMDFASDDVVRRLREFAFGFHREHAARHGTTRWLEKTAIDAFHVPEIEQLCGDDAYFVCITRHGLDVACSMRDWCERAEVYLANVHKYISRHARPLEAFTHAWVDATTAIRAFAECHPDNAILLRYEDLVANPDEELRRVIEFIGEPWDDDLISRALSGDADPRGFSDWKTFSKSVIGASSIGRWHSLSSPTIRELAAIANPTLVACGYEAIDTQSSVDDDDEAARRRYELGLMMQKLRSEDGDSGDDSED